MLAIVYLFAPASDTPKGVGYPVAAVLFMHFREYYLLREPGVNPQLMRIDEVNAVHN